MATAAGAPWDVGEMLIAHVVPGVGSRYVHPEGLAVLWDWQARISAFILQRVGAPERARRRLSNGVPDALVGGR
jgi:hypothetical protein